MSPVARGGPVSAREYRRFHSYALWAPGNAFDGLPLTGIYHDREHSGPRPVDTVTFLYATCESGGACASQIQVQAWPACLRNISLYGGHGAYTRTHVRGVPAAAFGSDSAMLEIYTGSVTIVIFGSDAAGRLRVAHALEPVNRLAGHPRPNGHLPPPVSGALAGSLRCS